MKNIKTDNCNHSYSNLCNSESDANFLIFDVINGPSGLYINMTYYMKQGLVPQLFFEHNQTPVSLMIAPTCTLDDVKLKYIKNRLL